MYANIESLKMGKRQIPQFDRLFFTSRNRKKQKVSRRMPSPAMGKKVAKALQQEQLRKWHSWRVHGERTEGVAWNGSLFIRESVEKQVVLAEDSPHDPTLQHMSEEWGVGGS
jgi:hypothetical protein